MSATDARADVELLAAAAGGSEHAFRALYRRHVRPVFWLAHGLLGVRTDAEDATQDTFVVAWRKLPELELAGDSLLPWLVTVCRYQCANRIRRQRREREHSAGPADDALPGTVDVEKQVVDAQLVERILAEVAVMSPLDQSIFRLCAADGYAYAAAAEALGVSHGVVRNRLSRIRTRVRTAVEEERA
ncbi:RNA polymerase sigma factor [Microbacterium sp.]|uniref:RNA polymerase sigma factor n=1 Tax=Microbacterium sp. TaxID=51671 RepID=UPI0039E346F1